jgi:phage-related minor tail protein
MIVVFWLEGVGSAEPVQPRHRVFAPDQLGAALKFAEELRALRRAGETISHVAIQSELVESVGHAGVSDPAKDYAHYKRRIDPAQKLGRPSGESNE